MTLDMFKWHGKNRGPQTRRSSLHRLHLVRLEIPMKIRLTLAFVIMLAAGAAWAQSPSGPTSFEVATVKPSPPLDRAKMVAEIQAGRMPRFGPHVSLSQAEYNFMLLRDLIAYAFQLKGYQITGPPMARHGAVRHCGQDAGRSIQG